MWASQGGWEHRCDGDRPTWLRFWKCRQRRWGGGTQHVAEGTAPLSARSAWRGTSLPPGVLSGTSVGQDSSRAPLSVWAVSVGWPGGPPLARTLPENTSRAPALASPQRVQAACGPPPAALAVPVSDVRRAARQLLGTCASRDQPWLPAPSCSVSSPPSQHTSRPHRTTAPGPRAPWSRPGLPGKPVPSSLPGSPASDRTK